MSGRFSTAWRVLRLVLVALVVLAPATRAEVCVDRIALVQGGRAARPATVQVIAPGPARASAPPEFVEAPRVEPRAAPVARFLLHRALLN